MSETIQITNGKQTIVSKKSEPIQIIKASTEEYKAGSWGIDNLRKIVEGMLNDGVIVLEGTTDPANIDKLNERMVEDAKRIRAHPKRLNWGTENIQQTPPLNVPEQVLDDIVANKLVFEAVTYILGPKARFEFLNGNTAMAGNSQRQGVHSDILCDYMNSIPFLVVNIPLIDFNASTGATEIWPGTHKLRDLSYFENRTDFKNRAVRQDALEERRKVRPPIQPNVPKGSIIIRDPTVWHCGVPNPSDQIRCMPALGFAPKWYKSQVGVVVPSQEVYDYIKKRAEESGIEFVGKVVSDEKEYVDQLNSHDFYLGEVDRPMKWAS